MNILEIRLSKDRKTLNLTFENGEVFALRAEYLRVESPSAEVMGHSPSERKYIGGKSTVGIMSLEPVGHYALRITFDDMHATGLFSWEYLYELSINENKIWDKYLEGLAASGGKREK